MSEVVCPQCGESFKPTAAGAVVGCGSLAAAGALIGAKIGIVAGPLGAAAGTIPGAIIGGVVGTLAGSKLSRCPKRGKVFKRG